ncbi:hypothetical protein RchiOBHm_Chr4g0423741 [Rosa chinensis]|uniref:Uncharacterized protein n=1 Tax=Rosa chinensis TaxID=74649 RepID=A0A2P6QYN3_ROSCH|nr:hypothetical protein RchiOBHm_Chr4g0423741 [Rosa chinensis]
MKSSNCSLNMTTFLSFRYSLLKVKLVQILSYISYSLAPSRIIGRDHFGIAVLKNLVSNHFC